MNVIKRRTLIEFWSRNPDAEGALKAWYAEAVRASWSSPEDIKARYPKASIVGNNRVVFNICGNRYRLVCAVKYGTGPVYVKFIGTHAEYDRIDVETYDGNPT